MNIIYMTIIVHIGRPTGGDSNVADLSLVVELDWEAEVVEG